MPHIGSGRARSAVKVRWPYRARGGREARSRLPVTQTKEYTAGVLITTRAFRSQGDAIVEESTNGTGSRGYLVDEAGTIIRVCDPSCASPTTSYLVTWNGHGDATALWRINADGTLTLANSYSYSTWGEPTTTTHTGFADLGFRFLYVGAHDVQWDHLGIEAGSSQRRNTDGGPRSVASRSAGLSQPRTFLGRLFSSSWTRAMSSALWTDKSVLLGK
ncbi:hypothetical protein BH20CHL7_BH20CHL7_12920 [soil metagenome]